jgi:hypothetical protein
MQSASFRCWEITRLMVVAAASFSVTACFVGDENAGRWASRSQVVDAAARCGVANFNPTKVGDAWAAYVDGEHFGHGPKGDCIYADLERQGLLATR